MTFLAGPFLSPHPYFPALSLRTAILSWYLRIPAAFLRKFDFKCRVEWVDANLLNKSGKLNKNK